MSHNQGAQDAVRNPLRDSSSDKKIDVGELERQQRQGYGHNFSARNRRTSASAFAQRMSSFNNTFVDNPELEFEYAERGRGMLPTVRKGAVILQVLLLLYFLLNLGNLYSGSEQLKEMYQLSYPSRFATIMISLLLTYFLGTEYVKNFWQDVLVFAVVLPVSTLMFFNGYKYKHFMEYYIADINLVMAKYNLTNVPVNPGLVPNFTVSEFEGGTVPAFVEDAMLYWAEKVAVGANRIWPPLILVMMLIMRVDFNRCLRTGVFSTGFWFVVNGWSSGTWFPGKTAMVVIGLNVGLLYSCWLSDRLSRRNFLYERSLVDENASLQGKLDEIEKYAEANDDEKALVKMIVGRAHEQNKEMHSICFEDLKLEKIIGSGASGEVIKATYLGATVVVKRMLRSNMSKENVQAFTKESELMNGLRHPNIVQFIGASYNTFSNLCMVLEWVERGDLFNLLRSDLGQQLEWTDPLLKMACDTACGMAYLHACDPPVIHRDLKSLNILVTSTFGCKITDFGMSRQSKAAQGVDMTMTLVGTPLWVPPEVIRSEKYSEKIDVYSYGICLTEMQTRQMPYADLASQEGMTKWKLLNKIANEGIRPSMPPPSEMNTELRRLIDSCLQTDPRHRPSMEQALAKLQGPVRRSIEVEARESYQATNRRRVSQQYSAYRARGASHGSSRSHGSSHTEQRVATTTSQQAVQVDAV